MSVSHRPNFALTLRLAALLLALTAPNALLAGGFELPDHGARNVSRGGAFTARADDLTALALNPGGLLRARDSQRAVGLPGQATATGMWGALLYSHNAMHAPISFQRAPSAVPQPESSDPGSPAPLARVDNETPWFLLGGSLFAATDFGLEDFVFAVGLYGPNAAGHQRYPVTGGQRYMLVELEAIFVYYSAAIAWGKRDKYGVGVTLQLAHQPMTKLSLVVDGTPGGAQSPYHSSSDVLATINLAAPPVPTALVGAWWRPIDAVEVGVSGRVVPVKLQAAGDVTLTNSPGGAAFFPDQLEIEGNAARLQLTIPQTARAGVRYRHLDGLRERFDVELDVVWEGWSALDAYTVELDGMIKLFAATKAPDVTIAKRWKDTLSVRLGGTYNLDALPLSLSAGTFYETAAVPLNYSHLDFPSFARVGVGLGATGRLGSLDWTVGYLHVFQESRTIDEAFAKVFQQRPVAECPEGCDGYDSVPANAGTITSGFHIITASLGWRF